MAHPWLTNLAVSVGVPPPRAWILPIALVFAGCGGSSPSPNSAVPPTLAAASTPTASPAAPTPPAGTAAPRCSNPDGGGCLNVLPAGTYTTTRLQPTLTYTVDDGWANFEDLPGNFLLVPPGFDLTGVDAGTSDYIGVYPTVGAPNGCDERYAPGIGYTPADLKRYFEADPGLATTAARATIGGHAGFVMDLRVKDAWKKACPWAEGNVVVPILVGRGASGLEHGLPKGVAIRLYLLDNDDSTMAIEVDDIGDAGRLDAYSDVVETFQFAP
jgi:hypothetical protein